MLLPNAPVTWCINVSLVPRGSYLMHQLRGASRYHWYRAGLIQCTNFVVHQYLSQRLHVITLCTSYVGHQTYPESHMSPPYTPTSWCIYVPFASRGWLSNTPTSWCMILILQAACCHFVYQLRGASTYRSHRAEVNYLLLQAVYCRLTHQ